MVCAQALRVQYIYRRYDPRVNFFGNTAAIKFVAKQTSRCRQRLYAMNNAYVVES